MEIKNAIIEDVKISTENGTLSCWLHLDYGDGSQQGFGGYALYLPKSFKHCNIHSTAGHFLYRCMEIAGVSDWNAMKGKAIRVKAGYDGVEAIAHIIKEDWFNPKEDFKV